MTLSISYEPNPSHENVLALWKGIAEHAKVKRNLDPIESFGFFIRDESNNIRGGCTGCNLYGCLYIDSLWVDELLRGQNYGTQLMTSAENWGKEKECTFATVNTMDWEALDFYKKLGFKIEFERHGFLKNSVFYFLRKDF